MALSLFLVLRIETRNSTTAKRSGRALHSSLYINLMSFRNKIFRLAVLELVISWRFRLAVNGH